MVHEIFCFFIISFCWFQSHIISLHLAQMQYIHNVNSLSPTLRVSFLVHIKIAVQCGFLWHKAVPSWQTKSTSECVRAKRVRDVCVNVFISSCNIKSSYNKRSYFFTLWTRLRWCLSIAWCLIVHFSLCLRYKITTEKKRKIFATFSSLVLLLLLMLLQINAIQNK